MIRFGLDQINATAAFRPEGYVDAVIAAGRLVEEGKFIELSDEAYTALRAAYSPAKWQLPATEEIAGNFFTAARKLVAAGFRVVPQAEYLRRMGLCRACPMWQPGGAPGLGRCERCGCGQIKHWCATEACPTGVWSALP